VEIVEGVALGDTVVVAGQQRLQKDGSPLRIVELGKPAAKPADAQKVASAASTAAPAEPAAAASAASR
jgi:membrane fusion protein, multidrug efflux system